MTEERLRNWEEIHREEGNYQFDQYLQMGECLREYYGTVYMLDPDRKKWLPLKTWIRAVATDSLDDYE